MRTARHLMLLASIFMLMALNSCATTSRIPTLMFTQYALEPGPIQNLSKSDIDISIKCARISDVYDYPEFFSFNIEDFPKYKGNYYLESNFPIGPSGKRWLYPFASPDASQQCLLTWVKIKNRTKHILRMKDARIYMVLEGQEPIAALSTLAELITEGENFKAMDKQQWDSQVLRLGEFPVGITRAFINSRRSSYKLINDISKEILPGFTYEGMLVFPVVPGTSGPAKISFFDVTTKTDSAGNPSEKTQFDFTLQPQRVSMWYDKSAGRWLSGTPPTQGTC